MSNQRDIDNIKNGIWAYFFLLIFEGALRKWGFSALSVPLLVVRDPLTLWMLFQSWKSRLLPSSIYISTILIIGFISVFTTLFLGHGNFFVALYGSRPLLLHFPLIFVIGAVFTLKDVYVMGKWTLGIAIPMTILVILQFYSPQSAWVNRGVGGDTAGAGFNGGALGYFRPPGTFSFTNGNTLFYSLVAVFVMYFWLQSKKINLFLLIGGTLGLLAAIPLSISRGLLVQVAISLIFATLIIVRKPEYFSKWILSMAIGIALIMILNTASFFNTAMEAFSTRISNASNDEGGVQGALSKRIFDKTFGVLFENQNIPFTGYGLGLGTNVGSQLTTGQAGFLIAEDEWPRILGELGPLFGLLVIIVRVCLTAQIAIVCYRQSKINNFLPWILFSFTVTLLSIGGWAQPSSLGFITLVSGLTIASIKTEPAAKTHQNL